MQAKILLEKKIDNTISEKFEKQLEKNGIKWFFSLMRTSSFSSMTMSV